MDATAGSAPVLFLLYAFSGFACVVVSVVWPLPLPPRSVLSSAAADEGGRLPLFYHCYRAVAVLGLVWLAFGTGCDNARSFAGVVLEPHNGTHAINAIASRGAQTTVDDGGFNYKVSWFCFFAHEVMGGMFLLPGVYLWIVAAGLPPAKQGCCKAGNCAMRVQMRSQSSMRSRLTMDLVYGILGLLIFVLCLVVGVTSFARYTMSAPLQLQWNPKLEVWKWGAAESAHNPSGLFGVFVSSGVWIAVGVLLWQWLGIRWFALLQLVSLVGQGVAGSLGDARELPSNFFEQMVTWALVGLGWQLRRRLERQQQRSTTEHALLAKVARVSNPSGHESTSCRKQ